MIAFVRPPKQSSRPSGLRHVRGLLPTNLLPQGLHDSDSAPPIARWKAWLFVGWLAAIAIWGVVRTLGVLF